MTMPQLDELARAARSDLARVTDTRAASRPELDVLRRRGTRRHSTNVVAVLLLVVVGVVGLVRLVAIGEVTVPVIGDVDPAPTEVDEQADEELEIPAALGTGPVTLEFDSGGPRPHRLVLTGDADGDVCVTVVGGTGASSLGDGGGGCGGRLPVGWLMGGRSTLSSSSMGEVVSCETGMVREDVAAVELHFPDGSVEAAEVLPAPEIGDAYYLTCWDGDRGLSMLVAFDEDGRELGRRDFLDFDR